MYGKEIGRMGQYFKKTWIQLNVLAVLIAIVFLLVISVFGKEPDWLVRLRKLSVFVSTKSDVEKVFNYPKVTEFYSSFEKEKYGWSEDIKYETKYGKLLVIYSAGKCSETNSPIGYDIDKNIVAELKFYPNEPLPIEELDYDWEDFEDVSISDVLDGYILSNDKIGVEIIVVKRKVKSITFRTTTKQEKLKCKNIVDKSGN